MATGAIRYSSEDGIGTVTIDRPERKGAMTYAVLADFYDALATAAADASAKAIVLTGTPGSFCAGTDLSDLDATPTDARGGRGGSTRATGPWPIVSCPKPVVAAIDGPAVGMGAEFATQCDVRIFSTRARIAWNFVKRGLVPDTGAGSFLLPRLIGPTEALRLLLSGEFLGAEDALRLGFASAVVAPESVLDAARQEAARYLGASPFSVARTKRLVYESMAGELTAHLKLTGELLQECFVSEDHKEGVASFLERREAVFTGR